MVSEGIAFSTSRFYVPSSKCFNSIFFVSYYGFAVLRLSQGSGGAAGGSQMRFSIFKDSRREGCSWFPEPCISSGSGTQLAKHWAEAADRCRIQINFNQRTVSGPRRMRYCPQTLLRRSKNIYI